MNVFDDGTTLETEQIQQLQDEVVKLIKKYTSSIVAAKYILSNIDLDRYSKFKDE